MTILVAHNYYQQPGGEDRCLAAEVAMLEAHGHRVVQYCVHNDAIGGMNRWDVAARTVWSRSAYRAVRDLVRTHRPRIVHFHNTFPLISPAAYYAARVGGAGVVQTLHNFRLHCPNALLFRDGRVCEDCLGRPVAWPGVAHGCYRGSRAASAAVAAMATAHRALGTWRRAVDVYIALTEFSRRKFIAGGLPAGKIAVKANFVYPDPGPGDGAGEYALFVGRLSAEKGIGTLLAAWEQLRGSVPLKVVGDGPMADAVAKGPGVEWLGSQAPQTVDSLMGDAAVLVLPSECYENFPRVAVEAFAKGTPVTASRLGAMGEVVKHGRTGMHFEAGNPSDLAATVRRLLDDPAGLTRMRQAARAEYDQHYTAASNYRSLMAIYERACSRPTTRGAEWTQAEPRGCLHSPSRSRPVTEAPVRVAPSPTVSLAPIRWPRKVDLFGVGVSVTDYDEAAAAILEAARRGVSGVVSCHAVHAIVTASRDPVLRSKVNTFDVVTPDGQPVRWAMNLLHRTRLADRVYGPHLMLGLCRGAAEAGVPVYLYGGTPDVLEMLRVNLLTLCPGMHVAGAEAPPFRALTPDEDRAVVERINRSGAGLVFIGLGCPKQDLFAHDHRESIRAVQVCVGAAFDFHAGVKKMAPAWMQRRGLEWLYRMVQEPGRLWRRYLVTNSIFLGQLGAALLRGGRRRGQPVSRRAGPDAESA